MWRVLALAACLLFAQPGVADDVTRTLAIVKPDAFGHAEAIREIAVQHGFAVLAMSRIKMDQESAAQLYEVHKDAPFFKDLTKHMSSGVVVVMVLEKEGAVGSWRELIGPTDPALAKRAKPDSVRALYGTDILRNAVHGSSSVEAAHIEIRHFFDQYADFSGTEDDEEDEDGAGAGGEDDDDDDEYAYDDEEDEGVDGDGGEDDGADGDGSVSDHDEL